MRAFIAALCVLALAPPQQRGPFDVRQLPVHGRRLDSLVYDFTGDGVNDVLHSSVDFDADPPVRWLALHVCDAAKGLPQKPDFIWPVHATAAALTFGNYAPEGGVEICTVAPDGVYYYPFENGKIVEEPRKLIHARTFFTSPSNRALPIWMFTHDLSADGRDDLILPVPDGYRVYFQTEPGRFGKISRLETDVRALAAQRFPEQLDFVASLFNVQTRLPRVAYADIDGDGRMDLITANGSTLTYFFQLEPNEYRAQRKWSSRFEVETLREEQKKDSLSYLGVAFHDVDGDRLPDLVVTKMEGQVGLFESLKTRIYIHLGASGLGNFRPDMYIAIHGVSIDPGFVDMDGDGKLDCLTSRLRTDLVSQALTGTILGDISVTYEVFQFLPERSGYSESPVYSYDVRVTFKDIEKKGAGSRPLLFVVPDLTGDGRADQVRVNPKTEVLEIHPGRDRFESGGARRIDFDATAHMEYKLERYPRFIQAYDVDRDGLTDLLLHYGGMLTILRTRRR